MNLIFAIAALVAGLVILWKSAELLVSGAVSLAELLGVSPLIIGLTVVAMGTSSPEVAASITAVFKDSGGDMAVGNVYGSNIANLALVGGLVALIRPIRVRRRTIRRELPVMLLVALLVWPLLQDLFISRTEGGLLLLVFAALILLTIYAARQEAKDNKKTEEQVKNYATADTKKSVFFVITGLLGLAIGAKLAVEGAVFIGRTVGLSEAVIGLTIIAIGTSLPELVTCVVAALKGQHDISVGNLVGSNIFNTLLVLGAAGVIRPFGISGRLAGIDYWLMVGVSVLFATAIIAGRRIIRRFIGAVFVCGYIGYIVYLFSQSLQK